MKFKKAFVTPVLLASMGIFSALSFGVAQNTPEVHAPDTQTVETIEKDATDLDRSVGIVDGLTREERAAKIRAYFEQYDLPLADYAMTFVNEADKYEQVDWRLLAAIGMKESTGGKFEFARYNSFGWGKQVDFLSREIAIANITKHLAGEDDSTSHHYAGKDTLGILKKYNSVIPSYSQEILAIMEDISDMGIDQETLVAFNRK